MSQETLELMLEAERRDTPWVEVLEPNDGDFFGIPCSTVVEAVTEGNKFDEACRGEIDAVEQTHYLRGPNAFDEQDLAAMDWERRTKTANQ